MSSIVDLSVVIVTHNVERFISDCLASLTRECDLLNTEIFVVDSASSDGTVKLVQDGFPAVRLRTSKENLGFSAANNLVLPECRGRYVLLLNPDTVVHEGSLRSLIYYMDENPETGAVGPTLRFQNGQIQPECARNLPKVGNLFPWLLLLDKLEWKMRFLDHSAWSAAHPPEGTVFDRFNLLPWSRDRSCEVESIAGACMMIRREVVGQIGLLDEALPLYLDDIDYCRRIRDAGWKIQYVAGPTITHLWQQSTSQKNREGDFYALVCHAIWLYLRKHDGRTAAMIFATMACVACLLRIPFCLVGVILSRGAFWRRQLDMSVGLSRWAFRIPKTPPRVGFHGESRVSG